MRVVGQNFESIFLDQLNRRFLDDLKQTAKIRSMYVENINNIGITSDYTELEYRFSEKINLIVPTKIDNRIKSPHVLLINPVTIIKGVEKNNDLKIGSVPVYSHMYTVDRQYFIIEMDVVLFDQRAQSIISYKKLVTAYPFFSILYSDDIQSIQHQLFLQLLIDMPLE